MTSYGKKNAASRWANLATIIKKHLEKKTEYVRESRPGLYLGAVWGTSVDVEHAHDDQLLRVTFCTRQRAGSTMRQRGRR